MNEGKLLSAVSSGPLARELADWLHDIRSGWTKPLREPLPALERLFWACGGSTTWLFGFMLVISTRDTRFVNFIFADLIYAYCILALVALYSFWFGYLVAFSPRKVGPVRLFLDGLLLPTATVSIIAIATEQVVQIPADSPTSSQSQETFPESEGVSSEQSAAPSAADPEEAGGDSPALPQESENEETGSGETPN